MAITLQLRHDTAANWTSNNPTLEAGEIGVEQDTHKMKVGPGAWNTLPYIQPIANASGQTGAPVKGDLLVYNGSTNQYERLPIGADGQTLEADSKTADIGIKWAAHSGGVTNFIALNDTPAAWTGKAGNLLKVNSAEDALEFIDTLDCGDST